MPVSPQRDHSKPFSLLIKPASADCNLDCSYCFYKSKSDLYPDSPVHRMSYATLEHVIGSYMSTTQPQYGFSWQGGEPLLMGLDFFKEVTELQMKWGRPGSSVANAVQTNGMLVNDPLARHFKKFNFLLGVSLDGPVEMHDRYRIGRDGSGTHAQVVEGLRTLQRHGVKTNVLTLVNAFNAARPRELYRYLVGLGVLHHQYIPCVEHDRNGCPEPYALSPEQWGDFLCAMFDSWSTADVGRVSVRYFDSLLYFLATGKTNACHMDRSCGSYLLVEHNGDVYPCDFFVGPQWKIGNVLKYGWDELTGRPEYTSFSASKSQWNSECGSCPYLGICSADCLKFRHPGTTSTDKSLLCAGYRQFFDHALDTLKEIAGTLQARPADAEAGTPRRKQPCPCGSGRKYRRCCGSDAAPQG
jgi:uncharacterized protein